MRTAFILSLCLAQTAWCADGARKVFDSLYGQRVKAATATADRADDIALAKDLLTAAQTTAKESDLFVILCQETQALGQRHPDGYPVALEALRLLAAHSPTHRQTAENDQVNLLTRMTRVGSADDRAKAASALIALLSANGDEYNERGEYDEAVRAYRQALIVATRYDESAVGSLREKVEAASEYAKTARRIQSLEQKLLKDADPDTAGQIVRLYVVTLNQPEKALPYLKLLRDEKLVAVAQLASKDHAALTADEAMALGEWLFESAQSEQGATQTRVLRRAHAALSRYLNLSSGNDAARQKVMLMVKSIDDRFAEALKATDTPDAPEKKDKTFPVTLPEGMNRAVYVSFDEPNVSDVFATVGEATIRASVSGTKLSSGVMGRARVFDGRGASVAIAPNSVPAPNGREMFVAAWIQPQSRDGVIMVHGGSDRGFALHLADGALALSVKHNGRYLFVQTNDRLGAGWSHVAAYVASDGATTLYVNGKEVGSGNIQHPINAPPSEGFEIGTDSGGKVGKYSDDNKHFKGIIDEVMLFYKDK